MPHTSLETKSEKEIHKYFPKWLEMKQCIQKTYEVLSTHGFNNTNTIPCVSLCRDELTAELMDTIDEQWRSETKNTQSFVMSCLAGQVFMGKTGMQAATAHAPRDPKDGKERFIFYIFPHIGFSKNNTIGKFNRPGIELESGVCGALIAFLNELQQGQINVELDPLDMEQSLLKQKLIKHIKFGHVPDLLELTWLAHKTSLMDLEKLIELVVVDKLAYVDYAVVSGVQIHTATKDYLWADEAGGCYCVVGGVKKPLHFFDELPLN